MRKPLFYSLFCNLLILCGSGGMAHSQTPNWVLQTPGTSPPARYGAVMAYDAARSQTVLFGGLISTAIPGRFNDTNDTWVWDGTNWTQAASGPSGRAWSAMAYDAAHGQIVLFGGIRNVFFGTGGFELNDTWVWDGTNWTQKSPATSPSTRSGSAMAYDATHGQIVLFGGFHRTSATVASYLNDTWVWDGTNWTQKSPATSPPPRSGAAMAYDATNSQTVLFGGYIGGNLNDTWVWDGTDWTQKSPATSPSARFGPAMAYDATNSQMVLFGGFQSPLALNDTWVWDGTHWTKKSPATSPSPRQGPTMAYDDARSQLVLFGGIDNNTNVLADTWVWIAPPEYVLTISARPVNGGSFTPASGRSYPPGTVVKLTATASAGHHFTGWTGSSDIANPSSAATSITMNGTESITANFSSLKSQTITFQPVPSQKVGGSLDLRHYAWSSSGLPLGFASKTHAVCVVNGSTASFLSKGSCEILATQPGNATYAPAAPVTRSFPVYRKKQTITFQSVPSQKVGGSLDLRHYASSSSGLPLGFSSKTPAVCVIKGSTVSFLTKGSCEVLATQSGNFEYAPATPVERSITVLPK
jgi:hypothetical protein